jgi:hypothetical protein
VPLQLEPCLAEAVEYRHHHLVVAVVVPAPIPALCPNFHR